MQHKSSVDIGKKNNENTELNIEDVPSLYTPYIDWYYDVPILLVYDDAQEEPAFAIALPTTDNERAELIGQRDDIDQDWIEEHEQ